MRPNHILDKIVMRLIYFGASEWDRITHLPLSERDRIIFLDTATRPNYCLATGMRPNYVGGPKWDRITFWTKSEWDRYILEHRNETESRICRNQKEKKLFFWTPQRDRIIVWPPEWDRIMLVDRNETESHFGQNRNKTDIFWSIGMRPNHAFAAIRTRPNYFFGQSNETELLFGQRRRPNYFWVTCHTFARFIFRAQNRAARSFFIFNLYNFWPRKNSKSHFDIYTRVGT
jgi:hypothetical protein